MKTKLFEISFRCHYPSGNYTEHRQSLKLSEVPKWIEAYQFTHPECKSISIKIWLSDLKK